MIKPKMSSMQLKAGAFYCLLGEHAVTPLFWYMVMQPKFDI